MNPPTNTTPRWLLYGATGYTGVLIAEEAVRRGHRPVLAGRSREKLAPLASRLGLESVAVGLDDPRWDAIEEKDGPELIGGEQLANMGQDRQAIRGGEGVEVAAHARDGEVN